MMINVLSAFHSTIKTKEKYSVHKQNTILLSSGVTLFIIIFVFMSAEWPVFITCITIIRIIGNKANNGTCKPTLNTCFPTTHPHNTPCHNQWENIVSVGFIIRKYNDYYL